MAAPEDRFTMYLDGHPGRRGNVLLRSFIGKAHRLEIVLNKLERAYIDMGARQTDFEIVAAEKVNPTTLTLRAVPKVAAYNPAPAFVWGMRQLQAVSRGVDPDPRVDADIADDLVKLAKKDSPTGYEAFWVNGYAEKVLFDEEFLSNATSLRERRRRKEAVPGWHVGLARGSVIGELRKVDDYEHDREFIIVPPIGPEYITCTFPELMRGRMGSFLFKKVRVQGVLKYEAHSPFPVLVDADENGIELYPAVRPRKTLLEMRGAFIGGEPSRINWGGL